MSRAVRFSSAAWRRAIEQRQGLTILLVAAFLAINALTRLALIADSLEEVSWDSSLLAAAAWGFAFDFGAALLMLAPLAIALAALPARVFRSRTMRALGHFCCCAVIYALLFQAAAEWIFWNEFGARFNFIAVDYLVYTTEVIGNIRESYALPWILGGLGVAALAIYALTRRAGWMSAWLDHAEQPPRARWTAAAVFSAAAIIGAAALDESRLPAFANNFNRELAKNGAWSFFAAFRANQLDYDQFYPTTPSESAFRRVKHLIDDGTAADGSGRFDLRRLVQHAGPERRLNVMQITVESLSANFLARYGSNDGLTPHLDALVPRALVFDQFYATGNRTDRGMEALTLSVPPTPGRSLVKRPHNEHLFTLGSVFRARGYDTAFIYGGFGYFDNMNHFFGGNGYRVVDRGTVGQDDITFSNVWGACDEDLFRWAVHEADAAHATGRPFFQFVMTTSNHRPYTFPDGSIDLPSKSSGRAGGVKYTDHAIGELLRAAEGKPWFRDTVFVIVADHCASSAGRAELPVQNYHIPLLIYAPGGQIAAGVVSKMCSQIDFAPTLLGLLGWTYESRFFGRDVLAPGRSSRDGRALIANYQRLGLLQDRDGANLAVLKPVRQMTTFRYDAAHETAVEIERDAGLLADAIAYYQTAAFLLHHGQQAELAAPRS